MKRITIEFYMIEDSDGIVRGYMHPFDPENFAKMGPHAKSDWEEWSNAVSLCRDLLDHPQLNPVPLHRSMPADKMLPAMAVLRLQGFSVVRVYP